MTVFLANRANPIDCVLIYDRDKARDLWLLIAVADKTD